MKETRANERGSAGKPDFRRSGRKRVYRIDAGTANGRRRDGDAVKREQGSAYEIRIRCAASGAGPGMISETVGAVVTENDVIEQGDADELAGLPETGSQGAVFGAGSRIAGRVIVRTQSGAGIHENERLEDFARVNDRQGERADRNDIKTDDAVFGIKSADHELFAVDALEAGSKERGGRHGSRDRQGWCCSTVLAD